MPNIRISQLDTATQVQGTDYLVIDNTSTTKRATLNTIFESDVAKAFKGDSITLSDYNVVPTNIQIKGELVSSPSNTIDIYTAVFVDSVEGKVIGENIIGNTSNKQGTIKFIDSDKNILYIKESISTRNINFTVGEFFGQIKILKVDDFKTTLKPNHTLKIFHATGNNTNSTKATELPLNGLVATTITNNSAQTTLTATYTYTIAQFRFDNGKISNLLTGPAPVTCNNLLPQLFNNSVYNRLTFRRTSSNYGVLIYRQVETEPMKLISVLGERELGNINDGLVYNDIGGFSTSPWTEAVKNTETGDLKQIFYFPLSASSINDNPLYKENGGFTVGRVSSISGRNALILDSNIYSPSNAVLDIFLNNASFISNSNQLVGGFTKVVKDFNDGVISKVSLPAGTYYTTSIGVSSYFNIEGDSKNLSIIKSIPWNFKDPNGNTIINCENTDRVVIKNLTLDGNYGNNTGRSTFSNNFLINAQNSSFLSLESSNVQNSVGGGIFAEGSKNLRLINNDINKGSLELLADNKYTGLYAPQSEEILLNGNNFENWLGPIDISVCRTGIAANNIIKNCGSGLLVYGSTSLTISPNIIVGLDNESLPVVDIHEDNFDSININLEEGDTYTSDIISYLREGQAAWLSIENKVANNTQRDGTGVVLKTQIKPLVKLNNQEYLLPSTLLNYSTYGVNIPIISIISTQEDLKNGKVQFKLTSDAVDSLPNYAELLNSYQYLARPSGEKLIGLVYKITAEEYLFTEDEKIYVERYRFINNSGDLELTFRAESIPLVSALAVNDIIYPIGVASGNTSFNKREIKIKSINGSISPVVVCNLPAAGIPVNDSINIDIFPANGYIGVKNNFVISKGRINKS